MTAERDIRPPPPATRAAPGAELKRIPLPALPRFRRPEAAQQEARAPQTLPDAGTRPAAPAGQAGPVSHVEMSELLAPEHEGGISPAIDSSGPPRTGATGATILNDLVDEIEKGLEREIARTPFEFTSQGYRRVVTCASGPPSHEASDPSPDASPPSGDSRRRDS